MFLEIVVVNWSWLIELSSMQPTLLKMNSVDIKMPRANTFASWFWSRFVLSVPSVSEGKKLMITQEEDVQRLVVVGRGDHRLGPHSDALRAGVHCGAHSELLVNIEGVPPGRSARAICLGGNFFRSCIFRRGSRTRLGRCIGRGSLGYYGGRTFWASSLKTNFFVYWSYLTIWMGSPSEAFCL